MRPVWSNFAKTSAPPRRKAKSLSMDGLVLSTPMRLEDLNKSNYAEVANLRTWHLRFHLIVCVHARPSVQRP
eukprot:2391117-Rhodomonas_salina.1